jgi:hypothetical protein
MLAGRGHAPDALEETARPAAPSATTAATATRAAGSGLPHERQLCLHLTVLRKPHRHRRVDRATAGFEPVRQRLQPSGDVVGIADEEVSEIHQDVAVARARNLKRPQHGSRERLVDVPHFRLALAGAPELIVRLHHQQARPDALELDDPRTGQRAAVDADVVRAETGAEAGRMQHFDIELGYLDEQPAAGLIPIHREEAVDFLHASGAFADRWNGVSTTCTGAATTLRLRGRRTMDEEETDTESSRERLEHAEDYKMELPTANPSTVLRVALSTVEGQA